MQDLKDAKEVLIRPRRDARYGAEYFVISNRQEKAPGDPVYFDENIDNSGLAIWHVIEPTAENAVELYSAPQTCYSNGGFHIDQKIVRLIRPGNNWGGRKFWSDADGVLSDREPNYVCADASNGWWGSQILSWADGTPSGYTISNISAPNQTMSLTIEVPTCQDRCGSYQSTKVCQCDGACVNYGDCCFDREALCP